VTEKVLSANRKLPWWQWQHRISWHVLPLSAMTSASQSDANKNANGRVLL